MARAPGGDEGGCALPAGGPAWTQAPVNSATTTTNAVQRRGDDKVSVRFIIEGLNAAFMFPFSVRTILDPTPRPGTRPRRNSRVNGAYPSRNAQYLPNRFHLALY